jgi:hypothetical protein
MNALTSSMAGSRMSVPTKATSLYVRAAAARVPLIADLLTEEERAAMATQDEDEGPPTAAMATVAITPPGDEDDIAALRASAGVDE